MFSHIEPQHEAVEQRFPHTQTSVEQGLPIHNETVEQRFPHTQTSVEQGLPIHNEAVEQGFPHTRTSVEQGLPIHNEAVEQGFPHTRTSVEQRLPIVTEVVEQRLPHTSEAVDDELPPLIDENERAVDLNVNDVVETELPRLAGGVLHPPATATFQPRAVAQDARESVNARKVHADYQDDEILAQAPLTMILY
uniref:Uncharacterized protein n=1 Tax=Peronospora matthiolae TaxID=2874970 RepID=A0AAV1TZW0_9STRA